MYFLKQSNFVIRMGLSVNFQKKLLGSTYILQQNQIHTQDKTTVDPKDVHRHGLLMDHWWDEHGAIKALHSMNLVRIPFIRDGIVECSAKERNATPLTDKKILDVGCGGGILSEGLARLGASVTGIDAGKELIELATKHSQMNPKLSNNCPSYICTSIEMVHLMLSDPVAHGHKQPLMRCMFVVNLGMFNKDHCQERKNYYDAVVASEVIEHVYNKELFVKSCVDALKPGGKIFFTTPNRSRVTQFFGIFVAEYVINLIPKGTHEYDKFMTAPELAFLLERNDCHVELTYGLVYNPISNRWKITKSQLLVFAMQAVKLK